MRLVKLFLIFVLFSFCFTSCIRHSLIQYYGTGEGGIRLKKPKKFKYNREQFANINRLKIDTTSIYRIVEWYDGWRGGVLADSLRPQGTLRFFASGEVLFYEHNKPLDSLVNNSLSGTPGYYMIEGNKIKIHRFKRTNRGQLEKYFGILKNDGTIKFYEQSVIHCNGSYKCLEKQNMYSTWKKTDTFKLKYFKLNW